MARTPTGAVTAAQFFELRLPDGTMMDAARATGLGYETVRRITHGEDPDARTVGPVRALADWSRGVAAARERGVWISAAKTLALEVP